MNTEQKYICANANDLSKVESNSVHLVVTSPPYPMIAMWDDCFDINPLIDKGLISTAYNQCHDYLELVWKELPRVLKCSGIVCINIGDAYRSFNKSFRVFSNHTTITSRMIKLGFRLISTIIWNKPSNKPNKFMGSGVLPCNAYVTMEHEYILVFRKGESRVFSEDEMLVRKHSALFWNERNIYYSDIWHNILGVNQKSIYPISRSKTAAYPVEIPYRLISMFSIMGDTVLDPFAGTSSTMLAAIATSRNSINYEIDKSLLALVSQASTSAIVELCHSFNDHRLARQSAFIRDSLTFGKRSFKYMNLNYYLEVTSSYEQYILMEYINNITISEIDQSTLVFNANSHNIHNS